MILRFNAFAVAKIITWSVHSPCGLFREFVSLRLDALFIGKGGKRPLVAMVTKGEVSGGGVGGRVGAESCPFVKYQNALLLETVF